MRSLWLAAASAALLSTSALAAGDTDAFRYLTREEAFALVAKPDPGGKPVSSYLSRHDDFSEAVIQRTRSGDVEIHDLYSDYMIMVEGRGTLTIGGTLKNRRAKPDGAKGEWLADSSTGGQVHELKPGVMVEGRGTLTIGGALKNRRAKPDGSKGEWLADSSTGGKVHELKPGVMVIVPKGMPHWVQLPPGGTLRYIFFKRKA